jgi:hypothetical protein
LPRSQAEKRGETFPERYMTLVVGCVVVSRKENERPAREQSAEEISEHFSKFLALVNIRMPTALVSRPVLDLDEMRQEIEYLVKVLVSAAC